MWVFLVKESESGVVVVPEGFPFGCFVSPILQVFLVLFRFSAKTVQ